MTCWSAYAITSRRCSSKENRLTKLLLQSRQLPSTPNGGFRVQRRSIHEDGLCKPVRECVRSEVRGLRHLNCLSCRQSPAHTGSRPATTCIGHLWLMFLPSWSASWSAGGCIATSVDRRHIGGCGELFHGNTTDYEMISVQAYEPLVLVTYRVQDPDETKGFYCLCGLRIWRLARATRNLAAVARTYAGSYMARNGWCSGLVDRRLFGRFRRRCSGTGLSMNMARTMPPRPAASSERFCRGLRSPELAVERDASNEHCGRYLNARLGLALIGWNGASEYSRPASII